MIGIEETAPVASRLFAHMMRVTCTTPIKFGDPIGEDDAVEMEAADVGAPPPSTPVVPTTAAQPFSKTDRAPSVRDWLVGGLGRKRGVMSAWPQAPGLKSAPSERVLLLDQSIRSGYAWWWLHKLKNTLYSRRDSYKHRSNETVYRLGAEPALGWNWFPKGSLYGMDAGTIDAFLHFGLAVTVREFPLVGVAPPLETQVSQCAIAIYLELEAAALGVAPPVFAAMLVFDDDDYSDIDAIAEVDATTPAIQPPPVFSQASAHVVGSVVASQLHTFRLSDMLRVYSELRPEENVMLVKKQIQDATVDLAAKIQRLAANKIIKLNMCASNIVFCPQLADSPQGDDWVLLGFGFKTSEQELITGKPYLSEFDTRLCKRMGGQADYDPSCAFVLMIAILLATVRAEFGSVATLMLRALLNQDSDGIPKAGASLATPLTQAFSVAASNVDVFRDMLLRAFQHSRPERNSIASDVFDELVSDFASTLRQPVTAIGTQTREGKPPVFHKLTLHLLNVRTYAACEMGTVDELRADNAHARKHRAYVTRVIRERQERIRARHSLPPPLMPL